MELAIGLLVDDAIVVMENVECVMHEQGLAPREATRYSKRKTPDLRVKAVAGRAMGAFSQIRNALVFAFAPPAVIELGNASGFNFHLQDVANVGHDALMAARNQFLGMASQNPSLAGVRPSDLPDTPQLQIDIDHAKAGAYGLSVAAINGALAQQERGKEIVSAVLEAAHMRLRPIVMTSLAFG